MDIENMHAILADFTAFSELLCDVRPLSEGLAKEYLKLIGEEPVLTALLEDYATVKNLPPAEAIEVLEHRFRDDISKATLVADIIRLWYLGKINGKTKEIVGGPYYFHYEALVWKVIKAHPPGLTGGYFGYWNYKPEL